MLALTDEATKAIEGILDAPAVPEGAGLRIAAPEGADAAPDAGNLQVSVVAAPAEGDQVIAEQGARVFVDNPVVPFLDDKFLDAQINGEQISFMIGTQGQ